MLPPSPPSTSFQAPPVISYTSPTSWFAQIANNAVLRREIRERWRRPMTFLLLGLYSALLTWMAYSFYSLLAAQSDIQFSSATQQSQRFFFQFSLIQILLSVGGGAMLAAPSLAIERARGSWRDMMLAGLSAHHVTFAKFLAMLSLLVVLVLIPLPAISLCYFFGGISPLTILAVNALGLMSGILATSIALSISARATTVGQAINRTLGMLVCLLPFVPVLGSSVIPDAFMCLILLVIEGIFTVILLASAAESLRDSSRFEAMRHGPTSPVATFAERRAQQTREQRRVTRSTDTPTISRLRKDLSQSSNPQAIQSQMDNFWEDISLRHPIAMREWRVRWRWSDDVNKGQRFLKNAFLFGFVVLGLWSCDFMANELQRAVAFATVWKLYAGLLALTIMANAAVIGADAFNLEREAKMLVALQLTTLSPRDIMVGKILSTCLWVARRFIWFAVAIPLISLVITCFLAGPVQGFMEQTTALMALVSCLVLAATVGVSVSLLGMSTAMASIVALVLLSGAFLLLPTLLRPEFSDSIPFWSQWWLAPLFAWFYNHEGSLPLWVANLGLSFNCLVLSGTLVLASSFYLSRMRSEETEGFWTRDLNRS